MSLETLTVTKSEISRYLPDNYTLISCASFEKRSTTVPLSVEKDAIKHALVFFDKNINNTGTKAMIEEKLGELIKFVEIDINYPILVARKMTSEIRLICSVRQSIVVDITTFTHECLLMLLKLLYMNICCFESIYLLYNGADQYSTGVSDEVWLSKGCKDVRNVLGYPGLLRPYAKKCLMILTGFEFERATKFIEIMEPDVLMLGNGIDPTNENHSALMDYYSKEYIRWQSSYQNIICDSFTFSCKDICKTIDSIVSLISQNPDNDYILSPLNTKLSTVATAVVALNKKNIQVCYSIPELYNVDDYSTPSNNIALVSLDDLHKEFSHLSVVKL